MREAHEQIDRRRGGQAFLGVDFLLAAPLNRVTSYERCLENLAQCYVGDAPSRRSIDNAYVVLSAFSETLRSRLEHAENRASLLSLERHVVGHHGPLDLVSDTRTLLATVDVTRGLLKRKMSLSVCNDIGLLCAILKGSQLQWKATLVWSAASEVVADDGKCDVRFLRCRAASAASNTAAVTAVAAATAAAAAAATSSDDEADDGDDDRCVFVLAVDQPIYCVTHAQRGRLVAADGAVAVGGTIARGAVSRRHSAGSASRRRRRRAVDAAEQTQAQKRRVFGVALDAQNNAMRAFEKLCDDVAARGGSVEGIFRISAGAAAVRDLRIAVASNLDACDLTKCGAAPVASRAVERRPSADSRCTTRRTCSRRSCASCPVGERARCRLVLTHIRRAAADVCALPQAARRAEPVCCARRRRARRSTARARRTARGAARRAARRQPTGL